MTSDQPARTGVVIVGSVTADVTTFSQRLPARGETILGDQFTLLLGGKGANQAVAAGLAGARTSFVGCVGDDLFHDLIVDGLSGAGVDLTHLRTVPGPTGIAHIRVDASAQNDIVMVPLANAQLSAEQIDAALEALAPTTSVLLTQLETPASLTLHITQRARQLGMTVVLDPAPAATLDAEVWRSIDIVTPNETEATLISGIEVTDAASAEEAGRWFLAQGVGSAVITMAEKGSCVVTAEGTSFIEPIPVEPIDTTAAGDAYAGYLGAALAEGWTLADA
ncbi:MAG TPA: ribokinase, partial [Microbacterium sp.]|nr:ribokinase [Microbacterium sp.]